MLSTRLWRSYLRTLFRSPRRLASRAKTRLWSRLRFEQLEDRVVPATDTWTAAGSGNWDVAANWSSGVPTSSDTVDISTTATATITVKSGDNINILSISTASTDTLSITGGSFEVTSGASTLSGPLSITGGTLEASGSGVTFTASSTTTVSQSNLYAEDGATLSLPNLTSTVTWGTFQAQGTNSVLNLSGLTTVTQQNSWTVNAYSGGEVNLSSLASLTSTNGMYFTDNGGSTILDPKLTKLSGITFTIDGTDANVANAWTSFTSGRFEVDYGAPVSLPNLTNVNLSSLYAENGGQLTLAGVTSYVSGGNTWQSQGTNTASSTASLLSVPNLTKVTQTNSWSVNAYGGATLNLSSLPSLSGTNGMYFTDNGGSTLEDPKLTTLSGVNFTIDGTDANVANTWTSFTSGRFEVDYGMPVSLPNLTNVNQSSLYAENGGQLTLAGVTSYVSAGNTWQSQGTNTASSTASLLSVPNLTKVTQTNSWSVNAYGGATLNLSSLPSLSGTSGMYFTDNGGSTLEDPKLTTLSGVNFTIDGTDANVANTWTSFTSGRFEVDYGSPVSLPNLTNVNQSSLYAENGGQLTLAGVTSYVSAGNTWQSQGTDTASSTASLLSVPNLTKVTQTNSWSVNAYGGATLNLSSLPSLSGTNGMYFTDNGGSTLEDPKLTTLSGVNFTIDGTDANVATAWTSFTSGRFEVDYGMPVSLPNLTIVNQSSLYAEDGGQLTLAGVTTYISGGNTWQSQGTDTASSTASLLSVPNLTKVTQTNSWSVNAISGGTLNLSGLTSLTSTNGIYITDTGGSTLSDPNLTTLSNLSVTLDGTDTAVANSWTKLFNCSFYVTGGSYTLPGLTDVDQTGLHISNGGSLTLPDLTSYASNGTFQADGTSSSTGQASTLDLPELATVTQQGGWTLEATNGGVVDVPGLTTLTSTNGIYITDTGNSTLSDPNLMTLSNLSVTLDGTDPAVANSWTKLFDSSFYVTGGSYTLPNLTDVDQTGLHISTGGSLTLPNLTSYASNGTFQADGSNSSTGQASTLNLPELAMVTQQGGWTLEATHGGVVDVPGLTTLTSTNGIYITDTGNSTLSDPGLTTLNGVTFSTDGTDPQDVAAWTSFTGGTLQVTAGPLTFPALTDMANATLQLSAGVSVNLPVLTQGNVSIPNNASVTIQGVLVAVPASGSTAATITVPASQGLSITIANTGTLSNTTFDIGAGTTLVLAGGTYLGGNTFDFGNGGVVDLTGGQTTTYGGLLTGSGNGTVDLASGRLDPGLGGVTLDFPGNMFQWTGSAFFANQGNVTNNGTINLAGSNDKGFYEDGTLFNYGTMIQTGTGNLGLHSDNVSPTTFVNEPGAEYLIESDSGIDNPYGGSVAVDNMGLIEKTTGSGTSQLYIDGSITNTGTIEAESGTLYLDANSFTQVSTSGVLTGGTWTGVTGGSLEFPFGSGIKKNDSNISVSGSGAELEGFSELAANTGTLTIGAGASLAIDGSFTNSGQLTIGGTLDVGRSFSAAAFAQTAGGTLNEQVGGATTGSYGQMKISGAATLAGTYALTQTNGFVPASGQTFPVMTFRSETGNFSPYKLGPDFAPSLSATGLTLDSLIQSPTNVALTGVTAPTTAVSGQAITVNWSAQNESTSAANGNWQDSVYLSTTPTITSSSTLLGSVEHTGGLAASGTYSGSWTGALPAVPPGNYYVLVEADSLFQLNDSNRANGTMAATTGQLALSVPALTLGTPTNGSFAAAGQEQYYQVTVPAGGSVTVTLASSAMSGSLGLYASQGLEPTPYNAQYSASAQTAVVGIGMPVGQTLTIPQVTSASTYYILVESVAGAAATAGFTLTATQVNGVTVTGTSSYSVGNGGNATIQINGTNFTPQTTASMSLGANTIAASTIDYVSASQLYATFNLSGAATGSYTLAVKQGAQSVPAPSAIQVVAANGGGLSVNTGGLSVNLSVPSIIRPGRTGTIVVSYTNTTNDDMVAPILTVLSTNSKVLFSTPDNPNDYVSSGQVLALAAAGPAGILRPGQSGQLTVTILSQDTINHDVIPIQVDQIIPGQTINWAAQESALQPIGMPAAAWSVVWSNLMGMVGTTTTSYNAALAQAATYLAGLDDTAAEASDVGRLWSFLVAQANADYPTPTLTTAVDASLPVPGDVPLAIDRSFDGTIAGRYQTSIFGLGWTTSWTTSATQTAGGVSVDVGGEPSYFALQANGTYLDMAGETASLTTTIAGLTFTEANGTEYAFLPDGDLSYIQDSNGNRVTAGYNGQNQLVTLAYSNVINSAEPTSRLTLAYNSQGFVSQVTDGVGGSWTYIYDTAGQLLSVTGPGNVTTTYGYSTGTNPETENALTSVTQPGGTTQTLTYSGTTGDLTGIAGVGSLTYTYGPEAEVTATDAAGDKTTVWYDDRGLAGRLENALGGVSTYQYDANGNAIAYTDPLGNTAQAAYDANGDLTRSVTPLGQTSSMAYNSAGEMTSFTDAAGNTTSYSYNAAGNLLDIAYPDGSQESLTYNPSGNLTETVLPNGDAISYQSNAEGLLTEATFADGTSQTFTYDAYGNLLSARTYSASDVLTGTTTLTYNAADELTSITYPGGLSLTFTYNALGQRTKSVDQTGYTVNYAYNAQGQLTGLTDGSSNPIVTYTYNTNGQLIEKQDGNGTYTTYSYDADGNLTQEVDYANAAGTAINSSFTYTYNVDNEQTSVTDAAGNVTAYGYDADGQLTLVTLPGGATISYTYNATGDRTQVVNAGTTTAYASNAANEVTQVGTTTYTYDANGNLATVTDASGTTSYTYNDAGQLVSITNPDGSVQAYQYSPLGFVVGSTETNGSTINQTNYLVDPTGLDNVVAEYTGAGSLVADYTYGPEGLVKQTGPDGSGYYDFDAAGNTVGITGSAGTYVNQYTSLPFGETTTVSAALPNPFTFDGQAGVLQLGPTLFQMRARDYSPTTGQFLSNDPMGLSAGNANVRAYAFNSPISLSDPTGLDPIISPTDAGLATAGGLSQGFGANASPWGGMQGAYEAGQNAIENAVHDPSKLASYENAVDGARNAKFLGGLAGGASILSSGWSAGQNFAKGDTLGGTHDAAMGAAGALGFVPGLGWVPLAATLVDMGSKWLANQMFPEPDDGDSGDGSPNGGDGSDDGGGDSDGDDSNDPNALIGPAGYGTPGFIADAGNLPYTVDFENDGSLAAQDVTVTQQLDSNLDWTTFELGSFGFGSIDLTVPAGLTQYQTTVSYQNIDGSSLNVQVSLNFNVQTGLLTASFTSLDPGTGETPTGVTDGFLYPQSDSQTGSDGFVQYTVQPKAGLTTGTTINQQASVVFDTNAPLDTQTVTNTLDSAPPTSTVNPLASNVTSTFAVSWGGSDGNGPGIAGYTVYVSINGGAYTPWLTNTTATAGVYQNATVGDTYSFYAIATDEIGLVQPTPSSAQATTTVVAQPAVSLTKSTVTLAPTTVVSGSGTTITLQAYTSTGVKELTGGLAVVFTLASKTGGLGTIGPVTDNGNGTYTATFTGTIAGSNTIVATIGGKKVTSKAATIKVTDGALDVANSTVTASAKTVKAGSKITITFQPKDAAGNKLIDKGLAVTFNVTGAGSGFFSTTSYNKTTGAYTATFTGTKAGAVTITASEGGATTATGAPVTVNPGAASVVTSFIEPLSTSTITVGAEIAITLQVEDAYGNAITASNLAVAFALGTGTGKGKFGKVTYAGNGQYTAMFTASLPGTNTITATIAGVKLKTAAQSITIDT